MLPYVTNVYDLPFGAQVDDVEVTFLDHYKNEIIKIRPQPTSYTNTDSETISKQLFSFITGAGINGK
jgi:hypothetical protein